MVDDHYALLNSLFEDNKELQKMLPIRMKDTINLSSSYILYLRHGDSATDSIEVSDLLNAESLMFILMAVYGDDFDRSVRVCNLLKNKVETMEKEYNMKVGGL